MSYFIHFLIFYSLFIGASHASDNIEKSLAPSSDIHSPLTSTFENQVLKSETSTKSLKDSLGITYFSFFYGPGIQPDSSGFSPNQLGKAEKHGLYLQNNVSFRYKFSERFAFDVQTRFNIFFNNYIQKADFRNFFWESPRIGISGKLLYGDDWSITGAINTDFPYFFPEPFSGFEVQQRKVLLNPGLFANFTYEPKGSKWSVFSVLAPRVFFYEDRNAIEPSYLTGGYTAQNKPEVIIAFQPTLNYAVTPQLSLSVGGKIDYRKHVLSDWNPFNASLASNGTDSAWRIAPMSVFLGVTYKVSPSITLFPFISTYPITAQRVSASSGDQATLLETTSIGMWLRGTLF